MEELNGQTYQLYDELLNCNHILIAGSTGTGKSKLIEGLIHSALYRQPTPIFYMIDPKRVDLRKFRNLKPLVKRATETDDIIAMLNEIVDVMENRYKIMEQNDKDIYEGPDIYVIIDEVADLILTRGKQVTPLIQRITQFGRAARIHCIMATQTVLREVISTPIKNNFDCLICLRVAMPSQSRTAIGISGAENLPKHGYGIINKDSEIKTYKLEMIPAEELERAINYWNK